MSDHATARTHQTPGEAPLRAREVLGSVGATATPERGPAEASQPWEPIIPLTPTRLLPPFPLDGFPTWLGAMVAEVTTALQVPADLPATLGLAGLAVAAGGRVDVSPVPGWVEPTNLYTVVALAPGTRKSPTFASMTRPLYAAEQALCDATESARLEAALLARRARAQAEKAARAAEAAETEAAEPIAEAISAAKAAHEHEEAIEPRLLADDLTPETAATLLAKQGGRLGLLSAEGGSFSTIAGTRYSASANLEPLLKAHAGDMMRVDRSSRAERIERPALTIAITTQPGHLASITGMAEARERGLLARFLYCLPANTVGNRAIHPPPVTEATRNAYEAHLSTLVVDLANLDNRTELTCTPAALTVLEHLERWLEPRLHPQTGELASITDWASKMAGAAVRLAGLLHLAEHGADGIGKPIPEATMSAAEHLARYYLAHALAVFDTLATDPTQAAARRVLEWITSTKAATFTRRELHRGVASKQFARATDLAEPLALLLDHGHIREHTTTNPKGGRPSTTYETHPDLL